MAQTRHQPDFDSYKVGWYDGYLAAKKDGGTTPLDRRAEPKVQADFADLVQLLSSPAQQ
jgi:hypothetical protein